MMPEPKIPTALYPYVPLLLLPCGFECNLDTVTVKPGHPIPSVRRQRQCQWDIRSCPWAPEAPATAVKPNPAHLIGR
jgi:hypothetical protein